MYQVEGANPALPVLSRWCSSANTPASHAGDHRSEAGQGRQFRAPKALGAMHSFGMGVSSVQFRVGAPAFGRVVKREQQTPQIESL